ncbi:MAG: rane dipeptidase [Bacillota bacterium]|jgi:membrane dipeptidase|nr:rane dipeptidase [Bacillota bacterium]MDK2855700.1 rane dipeptidase [Bacillota bacterium]MDK2924378.1 rane dipeptidase [Bacillota bacterium]
MAQDKPLAVIDGHSDVLYQLAQSGGRLNERPEGQVDLARLKAGGVVAQFFALYTGAPQRALRALPDVLGQIKLFYRELEEESDLLLALSAQDVRRAQEEGKVAAVLSLEGGEPLGDDPGLLEVFYRLGVRAVGLTWNERNLLAGGVADDSGGGLTALGREAVKIAGRLGMLVDVSHLNVRSFWDVLEAAEGPVFASHSSAHALCPHPRNLTDTQAKALAQRGGVIGVNFHAAFLRAEGPAGLEDVVRHIDYLVDLVGPEHVGLGSDFDGIPAPPKGLEGPHRFPALAAALKERGYADEAIAQIMGQNLLRLLSGQAGR